MINPKTFVESLNNIGIHFFTGVPDSLLKDFCAYVDDVGEKGQHIITANEGNAVALASGYHLSTGEVAAVYMQNSGLGNTINPLTSLADPEVYKIPMLLIIGWRGEPGVKDEPQHVKQGRITLQQLDILEIPYHLLDVDSDLDEVITEISQKLQTTNAPVALVVKNGVFSPYKSSRKTSINSTLRREDALRALFGVDW